jgi:hypothetical protein
MSAAAASFRATSGLISALVDVITAACELVGADDGLCGAAHELLTVGNGPRWPDAEDSEPKPSICGVDRCRG